MCSGTGVLKWPKMDPILSLRTCILYACLISLVAAKIPCDSEFGVDITDGEILENGDVLKDGLRYAPKNYVEDADGNRTGCICNVKPCVRKCCPIGEFLKNKTCQATETPFVIPELRGPSLDSFHVINGSHCDPDKQRLILDPIKSNHHKNSEFFLQANGLLYLPFGRMYLEQLDYCLDYIEDQQEIKGLACIDRKGVVSTTNVIGMIISMPFLLATFVVYAFLPDRNLHGKCLMCYVISLFWAYLLLVIIQLYPNDLEDAPCIIVGIFCLFFFMVSFFLMNVMSIDIWWTFSGYRGFSGSRKETERKRFLLYSGYAWGVPLLLVIIVTSFTLDTRLPVDAWYYPGIANGQCWFGSEIPRLLYFYGPIALLIITNIILFIITSFKIKEVQKATAVLRKDDSKKHSYENDKQRFNLYLKLMLAMGVNWSMEIISWAVNWQIVLVPQSVWYFTDFLNALYGVFIFFIFAFKINIWRLLKKRYYVITGKPNFARTITLDDYSPGAVATPPDSGVNANKSASTNFTPLTSEVA